MIRKRRPRAVRLRRARAIVAYWHDGRLTFENYFTRQIVSAEAPAADILGFFETWRTPADLAAAFPGYTASSLRRAVAELTRHTLLVRRGSREAEADARLARRWGTWLPQASFHFSTRDTPFIPERDWPATARRFLQAGRPPPRFKTCAGRPKHALPPVPPATSEFPRVLLARRTHRAFARSAVAIEKIGALLHYTWGATGTLHSPIFGPLTRKTSPSGGARHPGEVYLVAFDVDGLAPGLYHYHARDHVLERLGRGPTRAALRHLAVDQQHVGTAAAVFLMTAVFPRSMWKYRAPRAYRVVTLDAGHLGQTFCLTATWLELAPFTTAAMRDTALERVLGIDGIDESMLYIAGVGTPARESRRSASTTR